LFFLLKDQNFFGLKKTKSIQSQYLNI